MKNFTEKLQNYLKSGGNWSEPAKCLGACVLKNINLVRMGIGWSVFNVSRNTGLHPCA